MEVRIAAEGVATEEDYELFVLSLVGAALRAFPKAAHPRLDTPGVIALGHGGPDGVSDGVEQGRSYVLTPSDAAGLQGGWAYALACNTAPELATRLVIAGLWRAAGHNEALRLPRLLIDLEPDRMNVIAEYMLAIAKAAMESAVGSEREVQVIRARERAFDAITPREHEYMLDGFLEQLASSLEMRESGATKTAAG